MICASGLLIDIKINSTVKASWELLFTLTQITRTTEISMGLKGKKFKGSFKNYLKLDFQASKIY